MVHRRHCALIDDPDGPTGLVTTTDIEAAAAVRILAAHCQSVPDDLSLVTLGDSMLMELSQPPISAVRFSVAEDTRIAVDLLLDEISSAQPGCWQRIIPVALRHRHSTQSV